MDMSKSILCIGFDRLTSGIVLFSKQSETV